jgi:hypothetical protein
MMFYRKNVMNSEVVLNRNQNEMTENKKEGDERNTIEVILRSKRNMMRRITGRM